MKKITLLLLLSICFSFTQTEDSYKMTINKIADAYNAKDAKIIYNLFTPELQTTFTMDKVESFIADNQAAKGIMGEHSFLLEEEGAKRYLVEFENASTILVLKLSSENLIHSLSLEEY